MTQQKCTSEKFFPESNHAWRVLMRQVTKMLCNYSVFRFDQMLYTAPKFATLTNPCINDILDPINKMIRLLLLQITTVVYCTTIITVHYRWCLWTRLVEYLCITLEPCIVRSSQRNDCRTVKCIKVKNGLLKLLRHVFPCQHRLPVNTAHDQLLTTKWKLLF